MSRATDPSRNDEEVLHLHHRLLERDPTAAHDLAASYLGPLVDWLSATDAGAPEDVRLEAAEEALLSLIRDPRSFSPDLQTLEVYLRMSARGDLLNLLRKERRHHRGHISLESVEHSADAGKYLGRDDDPLLPLRISEEAGRIAASVPEAVRRKLSDTDLRALELMLRGERRTSAFAELWELHQLPPGEQADEVNRRKDRLKKMLKRSEGKS